MGLNQLTLDAAKAVFCGIGVISTFFTIIDFTYFLSVPNQKLLISSKETWVKTSWSLFVNMILLTLFVLQHSLLASSRLKSIFNQFGLQVIYRSLYVITTCGVLQVLMKNWNYTPEAVLWQFNLNYRPLWWLYFAIHTVAWILIYTGNICTDVTELLGVKQVYYNILNLPDPNARKSTQLQRLHNHMRHPSFLAFVLIFWMYPVMSVDRLILSSIFTTYMYIAWNTDDRDYSYQKYQYERKYHELQRLKNF